MVLAVLPMVELVEVTEGVHDGLEDRFPKKRGRYLYRKYPQKIS